MEQLADDTCPGSSGQSNASEAIGKTSVDDAAASGGPSLAAKMRRRRQPQLTKDSMNHRRELTEPDGTTDDNDEETWEVASILESTFDRGTYMLWYAVSWKNWSPRQPKSSDKWIGLEDLLPGALGLLRTYEAKRYEMMLANNPGTRFSIRTRAERDYEVMHAVKGERYRRETCIIKDTVLENEIINLKENFQITGIIAVIISKINNPTTDAQRGALADCVPIFEPERDYTLLVRWSNWKITTIKYSELSEKQKLQLCQLLAELRHRYETGCPVSEPSIDEDNRKASCANGATAADLVVPPPPSKSCELLPARQALRYLVLQLEAIARTTPTANSIDVPPYLAWQMYATEWSTLHFWPELTVVMEASPKVRKHEMYLCSTCGVNCYNSLGIFICHLLREKHIGVWLPTLQQAEVLPFKIGPTTEAVEFVYR